MLALVNVSSVQVLNNNSRHIEAINSNRSLRDCWTVLIVRIHLLLPLALSQVIGLVEVTLEICVRMVKAVRSLKSLMKTCVFVQLTMTMVVAVLKTVAVLLKVLLQVLVVVLVVNIVI